MVETEETDKTAGAVTRRRRWPAVVAVSLVVVLSLTVLGGVYLQRSPVSLPDRFVPKLEERLERILTENAGVETEVGVDAVRLRVSDQWRPSLEVEGAHLQAGPARDRIDIPFIAVDLSRNALVRGEVRPERIEVRGASLTLQRDADGQLSLATSAGTRLEQSPTMPELMAAIATELDKPVLSRLNRLLFRDVSFRLSGRRLADDVDLTDGFLGVSYRDGHLAVDVSAGVVDAGEGASLKGRLDADLTTLEVALTAELKNLNSRFVAARFSQLSGLSALDAPFNADLSGRLLKSGEIEELSGGVSIGSGTVAVPKVPDPVKITSISAKANYDAGMSRLEIDDLQIDSARLVASGNGQINLAGVQDARGGHVVSLKLQSIFADVTPLIDTEARVRELFVEARVRPDGKRIDIGQLYAIDEASGAIGHASGRVARDGDVWTGKVDAWGDRIPSSTVLHYWPLLKKGRKARAWVKRNLLGGMVRDATAAVRFRVGEKPILAASFTYEDGEVRVLRSLPPIKNAFGYGTVAHHKFTANVKSATMTPETGGDVEMAGTVFQVPDMRIKGADANLWLRASAPLRAALEILSLPPMAIQKSRPLPVDKLSGLLSIDGSLLVPLRDNARLDFSKLEIDGTLAGFGFSDLSPGKSLSAENLALSIVEKRLKLTGSAALNEVPLDLTFERAVEPGAPPGSRVSGVAKITPSTLDALGVRLPPGAVKGETEARFAMALKPDEPPKLQISSDLVGASLSVPSLNWRKSAKQAGTLEVDAVLGPDPEVPRLTLSAPGLSTTGQINLSEGGGFSTIELGSLKVGGWMDARAVLSSRGEGKSPSVALTGGRIDLRRLPGGGGSAGGKGPLTLALDRVRIAPDLELHDVRGTLLPRGVLTGTLTGRVNGQSPVTVDLAPYESVQGIRVTSGDAGGVFRSAKVADSLRGGTLDLVMKNTADGVLDGSLNVSNSRLVETPAAVSLLSAISIVGALDQMVNGGGLALNTIETRLTVSPKGVRLRDGIANGPALGITFDGLIAPSVGQLDLQGVVSPIYMLNAVGGIFSARRGEGLIGFNYRIYGDRKSPTVNVNPLSLLTPGVFRELFRRPPPDLKQ